MKKLSLKSKILLGALLLGSGGATANAINGKVVFQETTYNWTHFNTDGSPSGLFLLGATISNARTTLGCPGLTNIVCASGERVSGSGPMIATIYYE
ncbi:hypothetical protein H8S90_24290 [Olivibacter sp. SDN3]|uniref:hypothetical protein n=1 Tax=Olivibacter sp. SDN3 TaxID=2764720 RepID=UPI001650FCC4|nr:hypothetical protein [Olivibacter sp. SDN3]QNL49788.1 hypothetical protein H8S90_24290 [Olivibacter sp. SDN3]